jgi:hypothetical protein
MQKAVKKTTAPDPKCPALAMARLIDAAMRQAEEFQNLKFRLQPDKKHIAEHADDTSQHIAAAGLQALALTKAESLEGAIAKTFIAFGVVASEMDMEQEGWHHDHSMFLAKMLMADAQAFIQRRFGPLENMGACHWYVENRRPDQWIKMAESLIADEEPRQA